MKLYLAITLLFAGAVVADPTQCFSCQDARDAAFCTSVQRNQSCATDSYSLGTTHCGSVAIKYRGFGDRIENAFYRGCFNCTDKRTACFTLGGFLKDDRRYTLLECEIECCTGDNCNTQVPTLSQAAISVFPQNVSGPRQCQSCLGDDSVKCLLRQESQICAQDREALGTTHCGSGKIKYHRYRDNRVEDGVIRGCIDCADKKAACALISGYVKSHRRWSLTECDIECCTGNNCNDKAVGLPKCHQCYGNIAATCLAIRRTQLCTLDPISFGTTHCGSAVGKYIDQSGKIIDGFYQGCINCTDKKAACEALEPLFKVAGAETVLECNVECCTGENCNEAAFGFTACNYCVASDAASCSVIQKLQTCANFLSLGKSHCGSAVGKYLDYTGKELNVFYRGCIDCTDKKAACFKIGGALKIRGWTLLKCEIECCNSGQCQDPTLTQDAINVFTPKASGPTECNSCLENNATSCSDKQRSQRCSSPVSLGATHCGSAVVKYRDYRGDVVDGFVRGCINCADKKAACALLGGFLKASRGFTQLECEIECCTEDNCNNQIPTLSKGGSQSSFSTAPISPTQVVRFGSPASSTPAPISPTPSTAATAAGLVGCHVLLSGILVFASTFVNIMIFNHI